METGHAVNFAALVLGLWSLGLWSLGHAPALPARLPPVRVSGVATVFYPGDGQSGDTLGCVRAARRLLGSARFVPGLPVIAMRPGEGPPCGTRIVVEHARTRLRTVAFRLDAGPFGATCPEGRRVVRGALPDGCVWCRVADLTRHVARQIGHDGRDPVNLRWE